MAKKRAPKARTNPETNIALSESDIAVIDALGILFNIAIGGRGAGEEERAHLPEAQDGGHHGTDKTAGDRSENAGGAPAARNPSIRSAGGASVVASAAYNTDHGPPAASPW